MKCIGAFPEINVFDLISTHAPKSISQQSDYIVCSPSADVVFHSGHATGSDLIERNGR